MWGLRKNVAAQGPFPFTALAATSGGLLSGETVTARRFLDGTWTAATGSVTSAGSNGEYYFTPSQADTNGTVVGWFFTSTNMIQERLLFITTAADPTNGVNLGLSALPSTTAGSSGGVILYGTSAGSINASVAGGILPVNAVQINFAAQSPVDLGLAIGATNAAQMTAQNATSAAQLLAIGASNAAQLLAINASYAGGLTALNATSAAQLLAIGASNAAQLLAINASYAGQLNAVNASYAGQLNAINSTSAAQLLAINASYAGGIAALTIVNTNVGIAITQTTAAAIRIDVGLGVANLDTQLGQLQSDSDDLQLRVPLALTGGKMESNVGSITDGVITSAKFTVAALTAGVTTFLERIRKVTNRYMNKKDGPTNGTGNLRQFADDGITVESTQAISITGNTITQGPET